MLNRRKSRDAAFGLIYESEYHAGEDMREVYERALVCREIEGNEFIENRFFGTLEHLEEIDAKISEKAKDWNIERLSVAARAVLRLGIYEILYTDDVSFEIAINEAMELIKEYGEESAGAFVNGILDAVAKEKKE